MMHLKTAALAAALMVAGFAANAATVLSVGTTAGPGSAFTTNDGIPQAVSDPSDAWIDDPFVTNPASYWIWGETAATPGATTEFYLDFSLVGFDLDSAFVSITLAFDDIIDVYLNGTSIFSDHTAFGPPANWVALQLTGAGSPFAAANTLKFVVNNENGGPAGLRAAVTVGATPIPVPAALPLLGAALAGLGFAARRKRAA